MQQGHIAGVYALLSRVFIPLKGAHKTSTLRGVISAVRINDLEFEILGGNIVFFHKVIEISPVFSG